MILASRAEPGCAGYDYAFDLLEPDLMRVRENDDAIALDRGENADLAAAHVRGGVTRADDDFDCGL